MTPRELTIETRYLRFAARGWGPAVGTPVLALHGWLDNAASFDRLAPLLPECRLIALDLAGHGESDWRPPGVHYHFVDYVEDVVRVADALAWERFALLGHSLGAAIASCVAAVVPERIDRLALIEGLGPLAGAPGQEPAALRQAIRQMSGFHAIKPPIYRNVEEAARARKTAGDLRPSSARILSLRGTRQLGGGLGWRSDPRLRFRSPHYLSEPQILAYLEHIEAPVLLILARRGLVASRPAAQRRVLAVRRLVARTLAGGHHLHLDAPARVARVLRAFLCGRAAKASRGYQE